LTNPQYVHPLSGGSLTDGISRIGVDSLDDTIDRDANGSSRDRATLEERAGLVTRFTNEFDCRPGLADR
jgi:hypothetical protein